MGRIVFIGTRDCHSGGIDTDLVFIVDTRRRSHIGIADGNGAARINTVIRIESNFINGLLNGVGRDNNLYRVLQLREYPTQDEALLRIQVIVAEAGLLCAALRIHILIGKRQREVHLMARLEILRQTIGEVVGIDEGRELIFRIVRKACRKVMSYPSPLRGGSTTDTVV